MREGWRKTTIAEVSDVINGGTPKTGVAAYWGGEHMWITPAEMGGRNDPHVTETERQLTSAGLASANLLPPRSVILSSRAPIGHLVINTVPMATNQGCKGLVPKPGVVDYKYLFYYLGSIVGLLNDLGTGTTFKELSGGKLKEAPIPLAPLSEQQRIVAILDEAFAGLATATANAEKNLKNARELFDTHLKHAFRSEQEGWIGKKLGEVCRLITDGKHGDCANEDDSGYYFLSARDVKDNTLSYERARQIAKADFEETHRRTNLEPGDVLVTNAGTIGRIAIAPNDERTRRTTFQKSVAVLKIVRGLVDSSFCAYSLATSLIDLQSLSAGTAQKNLLLRDLRSFPFWIPNLSKQKAIVDELDQFSNATRRLEKFYHGKIDLLENLKHSILQKAFSGELTSPPSSAIKEAAE